MFQCATFLALSTSPLFAAHTECSDIRLDDRGGAMEHVSVRNQFGVGNCYAQTAAQIYDAWRFRHDPDADFIHQSSGFEIGQRFKIRESKSNSIESINGGVVGGVVEEVIPIIFEGESRKRETCSEVELNSVFHNGQNGMTIDEFSTGLMAIYNEFKSTFLNERLTLWQFWLTRHLAPTDRTRVSLPRREFNSGNTEPSSL